ncbi:MAG: bifunctional transaldolase/phosoglucose isomerase, partial [Candidatus Omnitrophica bacterium]|nr:bifunctional transaldolase/phosoglucose isomerase [Candidatus Omnitrophota bacterium]
MNSLKHLADYGQSIWLDYLRRQLVVGGELDRLIEEDGLRGMTSNPKIFEKAIGGSHDYDVDIRALALQGNSVSEVYESLSVEDVQSAADKFRPLYEESNGDHGFVSLEVNPHLARDTEGTIKEAKHLWNALNRPNVFIKVPATVEGLPAIRRLIAQGVNVNVTLLFGLPRYRKVAEAYIAGLEDRAGDGAPLDRIRSVASFFLSRIDVLVDPMLEKIMKGDDADADLAKELHGEVALSSAKVAYQIYREIFSSERFQKLAALGAQEQRLLWASTSTKNPEYSDIKYIEPLIGEKTINTTPPETLNAYRDHGDPKSRLEEDVEKARETLDRLPDLEIDIDEVTQQLVEEGIEKFNKPFDKLMDTLEKEMAAAKTERVDPQTLDLGEHHDDFERRLTALGEDDFSRRLWNKDATLWASDEKTQKQIEGSLGWLHVAEKMESQIDVLEGFVSEVRGAGFQRVVHMGMGGSSLAPLMFSRTFEVGENGLPLTVLDTTDPKTIGKIEESLDLEKTLFIIASKSGSTAESLAFGEYFYDKVKENKGDRAGENFVAITDPESPLVTLAQKRGFRRCFLNYRDIGGRYSALSWFGLLPAGLMGLDVSELLIRALRMSHACNSCIPAKENPGIALGAALGELARDKRDKVTFIASPAISTFGLWLEQL